MPQVVVEMTAEEAKLWRAQQRIIAQTKKLEDSYKKVGSQSKQTSNQAQQHAKKHEMSLGKVTHAVMGVTLAYHTAQMALSPYIQMIEKYNELSRESLDLSKDVAGAQERALKNMQALRSQEIRDIFSRQITEIQAKTGFPDRAVLTQVVGEAFGTGAMSKEVMEAVRAAAPLSIIKPEDMGALAKGGLDIRSAIGEGTINENIAFLASVGALTRVEQPTYVARNLGRTLASALNTLPQQGRREAAAETAALFATLTQTVKDVTGERTRTAAITLTSRLGEFFRGREDDPGTLFGRIQYIRQNRQAFEEFFKTPFGQEAYKQPYRMLFDPKSPLFGRVQAARKQLAFDEAGYQRLLERQKMTPELLVARAEARAEANRQLAIKPPSSVREIVEREFVTAVERTGGTGLEEYLLDRADIAGFKVFRGGGTGVEGAIGRLKYLRRRYEREFATEQITRKERDEWIGVVERAIQNIEQLADSMEKLNRESAANAARKQQAQNGAVEAQ